VPGVSGELAATARVVLLAFRALTLALSCSLSISPVGRMGSDASGDSKVGGGTSAERATVGHAMTIESPCHTRAERDAAVVIPSQAYSAAHWTALPSMKQEVPVAHTPARHAQLSDAPQDGGRAMQSPVVVVVGRHPGPPSAPPTVAGQLDV
jgi:hypothetical protein